MREPNFKLDWFIPTQIIGLTHFHSAVTPTDVAGVLQRGAEMTQEIEAEFSILIDNRVVGMPALMTLEQMVQMVPYINHPWLRWIVVVKPENLSLDLASLTIEKQGDKQLKNVADLAEALAFLQEVIPDIQMQKADRSFFPNSELDRTI